MGDSGVSSKDQSDDKCIDCVQEVSEGNEDTIGNRIRSHSCSILAKNLATFCSCLEPLCKT